MVCWLTGEDGGAFGETSGDLLHELGEVAADGARYACAEQAVDDDVCDVEARAQDAKTLVKFGIN